MNMSKIIIIGGNGIVGRALLNSFIKSTRLQCLIVDPTCSENLTVNETHLLDSKFIFLCLPTPVVNGKHDNKLIDSYLKTYYELSQEQLTFKPIIVINSTTTENFQEKYPSLKIVYNPEFIQDHSANDDFIEAKQVVIGGNISDCILLKHFYIDFTEVNDDVVYSLVTIEEAINYKYLRNLKHTMNLIFWEIAHDLTKGGSKKIKHLLDNDPVGENNIIGMDGYRGFGGKCLPKDLDALIEKTSTGPKAFLNVNKILLSIKEYNQSLID